MANVNVFDSFIETYGDDNNRSYLLYNLFSGDLDGFDLPSYWRTPESKAERQAILDQYDYEFMEGDTGGEGQGEYCYGVIRFQGKYYRAEWTYYSYNGCEYDSIERTITEVTPKQVMVTQYVKV